MTYSFFIFISLILVSSTFAGPRVLFVRGGPGTGGFLEGGADEQLADITDYSTRGGNHGWGELADWLRENDFELDQMIEGPANDNTPIPFADLDLTTTDVIVLGSNNADYQDRHIDAIEDWVKNGGGLLVISDANFGRNWGDAPDSDQQFLDRFGWTMNQDQGTYALRRSANDFLVPNHPILEGVQSFDGEGVSPIMVPQTAVPNVQTTILAQARGTTRMNNRYTQGSSRQTTGSDGSLVIAEVEAGRVVGHFDRNTFFNRNGAGTDLHRLDNRTYALNLFRWLAFGGGGLEVLLDEPVRGDLELASLDQTTRLQATAFLFGEKLSIFNPASYQWTQLDGPGQASFSNDSASTTTVQFSAPGAYRLRVQASHRDRQAERVLEINVALESEDILTEAFGEAFLSGVVRQFGEGGEPIFLLRFQLQESDFHFTLESSDDLETWLPLVTEPSFGEDGWLQFRDVSGAGLKKRYFRVRVER